MLATSALSPGEKIWFKNRTLLACLPLATFPRYAAKTNGFQLAKALLKGAQTTVSWSAKEHAARSRLCGAAGLEPKCVYSLPTPLGRNGYPRHVFTCCATGAREATAH